MLPFSMTIKDDMDNPFRSEIEKSIAVLRDGGVILYPTDTIWGLGCDATNREAVSRIYRIKKREDSRSMLVLLASGSLLPSYVKEVPEISWELLDVADDPLTIIYPGAKNLAPNLVAEDGSIGIRIVKDPFCEELLRRFRKPVVSTSANISGSPSPSNFRDISEEISGSVDHIVDWRRDDNASRTPSSIIKIDEKGRISIIR